MLDALPFAWVKAGHKLTYTYYSPTDTTLNALTLTVIENPDSENLGFQFSYPQWTSISSAKWIGDNYNVYRKFNGLYKGTASDCGFMNAFSAAYYFMRAPLAPVLDTYYPDYLCKGKIFTAYKVVDINKTITVPAGSFNTFVLQDTATLKKEYWNEKNGIIMFDLFDTAGVLTGQYKLTSKNY